MSKKKMFCVRDFHVRMPYTVSKVDIELADYMSQVAERILEDRLEQHLMANGGIGVRSFGRQASWYTTKSSSYDVCKDERDAVQSIIMCPELITPDEPECDHIQENSARGCRWVQLDGPCHKCHQFLKDGKPV